MHIFSSTLYGVMFKVTVFVQQGICINFHHKTVIKNYLLHLKIGDDMT